jgi:uncharacterized protein YegL
MRFGKKSKTTDIHVLLDRSGSMDRTYRHNIRDAVIKELNTFLDGQRNLPGAATVSIYTFNTYVATLFQGMPIATAPRIDATMYAPDGWTAYYDAGLEVIGKVLAQHDDLPKKDRPAFTVFVIVTDGQDNRSRHSATNLATLRKEVEQKFHWTFIDLTFGSEARGTAVSGGGSIFAAADHTPQGIEHAFTNMGSLLATTRAAVTRGHEDAAFHTFASYSANNASSTLAGNDILNSANTGEFAKTLSGFESTTAKHQRGDRKLPHKQVTAY